MLQCNALCECLSVMNFYGAFGKQEMPSYQQLKTVNPCRRRLYPCCANEEQFSLSDAS